MIRKTSGIGRIFAQFAALSRGQKYFLAGLGLVVLLPFTVLMGLQIHNAAQLAILGHRIAAHEDAWKAEVAQLARNVDPASLENASSQFAYRLMAHHGELLPERRVVVTIQVPLDDMRKKAAKADPQALLDQAAERIQTMGEKECKLLVGALARQCSVMEATGRALGDIAYEYQLQLAFTEIRQFGKSDPSTRYEFVLSRSSPGRAATNQRIYFDQSAGQRRRIYADVAETCQAIRSRSGNCSVTALSVASRLDRGTPMARLAASAAYASLVKAPELAASTR